MNIYGPKWAGREFCADFIKDLENKNPVKIGGPFYGDFLDGILHNLGFQSRDRTGRYETIWKELEKGN